MKKTIKFIVKPILTGIFFSTGVLLVYAATTLINSVTTQTINQGDTIGSGWFQEVNDKLVNVKIYNGSGIVSEYVKGKQQLCIGTDCRSDWPSGGSSVWSTGTAKIYYQSGDVGIGTNVPNQNLHIKENNGNAEIDIESEGVSNHWGIYQDKSTEQLRFWNNDDRVIISSGGNVGIGAANPETKLHVGDGKIRTERIDIIPEDESCGVHFNESNDGDSIKIRATTCYGKDLELASGGSGSQNIRFSPGDNEVVRMTSNGNVGIGTAEPDSDLEIKNNSSFGVNVSDNTYTKFGNLWSSSDTASLESLGSVQVVLDNNNNDSAKSFIVKKNSSTGSGIFTVKENGNVGIGTTTPDKKMDVNGNSIIRGDLDMKGNAILNADVESSFYYAVLSLDDQAFKDSEGIKENITLPSSGNGTCSDGKPQVCVYNDGGLNYEISFDVSEADVKFDNFVGGRQIMCWPVVPGDTEGYDSGRYPNSVAYFGTDINGGHEHIQQHNGFSAPDTGPAVEVETTSIKTSSHNSIGVMCLK